MTSGNPDKLCEKCLEFDRAMNGGPNSLDVWVQCDHEDLGVKKMKMEDLEKLSMVYHHALNVCDPIEFANRQKKLVYAICDFLLKPLNEIDEKKRKETAEGVNKFFENVES